MWTENGDYQVNSCESAYGNGACLEGGDDYTTYTTSITVTATPSGYSAPTMASDLSSGFNTNSSIPIPTIPTSFYPGLLPSSALAGASATSVYARFATHSSAPPGAIPTLFYSYSTISGAQASAYSTGP
jgi:rhamnogalacturonan hydrolase